MEYTCFEKAIEKRNIYNNKVISVTGTCGKTTTCKFIYDILKHFNKVNKTHENSNSFIGIPWCLNKHFELSSEYWIIEIGISKENEMKQLVQLVKPDIRIITNIGIAHTLNFTNGITGYINEKLEFTKNISQNSVLIINNDDNILNNIIFENINVIRCGTSNNDDVQLIDYFSDNIKSIVKIKYNNNISTFKINGIGKHNALNLCLAIGCAVYLKISIQSIEKVCKNFELYEYRGNIIKNNNIYLYDHSYNCSVTAILSNLSYFKELNVENKIIILGDIEEIENSVKIHNDILLNCFEITNNVLIYSINKYKEITNDNNYNLILFEKHEILNTYLKEIIKDNTKKFYIFIQGSNSSNLKYISDYIKKL